MTLTSIRMPAFASALLLSTGAFAQHFGYHQPPPPPHAYSTPSYHYGREAYANPIEHHVVRGVRYAYDQAPMMMSRQAFGYGAHAIAGRVGGAVGGFVFRTPVGYFAGPSTAYAPMCQPGYC